MPCGQQSDRVSHPTEILCRFSDEIVILRIRSSPCGSEEATARDRNDSRRRARPSPCLAFCLVPMHAQTYTLGPDEEVSRERFTPFRRIHSHRTLGGDTPRSESGFSVSSQHLYHPSDARSLCMARDRERDGEEEYVCGSCHRVAVPRSRYPRNRSHRRTSRASNGVRADCTHV